MSTPFVEVVEPEQAPRYIDLLTDRNLVGSGGNCPIQVDRPEFAREHILIAPQAQGCFVALARGVPTPITYNNAPLDRATLPWGASFFVGPVRFTLHDGSVSKEELQAKGGEKKKEQANPVLIIAAVLVLGFFGYTMTVGSGPEALPAAVGQPPPLFDSLEQPCGAADPAEAARRAREEARIAAAGAERRSYRVQDGVAAVNHFAIAAACYRQVGDVTSAESQRTAAQALMEDLERDYRNQLFRLDRARELGRQEDMLIEARLLHNLIQHRNGPYIEWLTTFERRLVVEVDRNHPAGH